MQKIRTGILGGSFDPVHKAHVELAKAACKKADLEEMFFIPAKQAPLRDAPVAASYADRLAMLRLALKTFPAQNKICLFEMERDAVSYSIDTAKYLVSKYPNREFFWIIGADHIEKLKKWREIDELCALVSFVCAARPGYEAAKSDIPATAKINFIDFAEMPHSSTAVRNGLKNDERAKLMLDDSVLKYILKHKLYYT